MTNPVDISMDRLLWRTAGREWGYRFVMCPPFVDDPYSLQVAIFGDPVIGSEPVCWSGRWDSDRGMIPFVATAFQDVCRRDNALRPIVHYLTWFPPANRLAGDAITLPDDWGLQVIKHFAEVWGEACEGDTFTAGLFDSLKGDLVRVDAARGRPQSFGAVTTLKKNEPANRRRSHSGHGATWLWGLLILLAILLVGSLMIVARISQRSTP